MCRTEHTVFGLDSERDAHEVEQYLVGIPHIEQVTADRFDNQVVVEWDESKTTKQHILDEIEHAGCKPKERCNSLFERLKRAVA